MTLRSVLPLVAMLWVWVLPAHAVATHPAVSVTASHAWIRLLPGTLPAGGYVTLHNAGDKSLVLTGASSPDYQSIMLHRSILANGMSRMVMIKQLKLPAHATIKLAPGGYHLMLMQAMRTIHVGDTVPVVLHFANGGQLHVNFKARPANAH
ncbi:MAG TPA: copper chaperone PCu(A)C [Rhodanobacteraceae bacterium]